MITIIFISVHLHKEVFGFDIEILFLISSASASLLFAIDTLGTPIIIPQILFISTDLWSSCTFAAVDSGVVFFKALFIVFGDDFLGFELRVVAVHDSGQKWDHAANWAEDDGGFVFEEGVAAIGKVLWLHTIFL